MRVLHIIHTIAAVRGGPSRSVPNLCRAQQAAGAQVRILAQTMAGELTPELAAASAAGVQVSVLPLPALLRAAPTAMREADVVHIHGIWTPLLHGLSPLARALGRPVVFSTRGMLEPGSLSSKALKKQVALRLLVKPDLQRARLLHATGELEAQHLRRLGLTPSIAVIPNGVELPPEHLCAPAAKGEDSTRTPYVLYLGRLHPHKGLPMLVSACGQLRTPLSAAGVRVRLVGPDIAPHGDALRGLIEAAGLSELMSLEPPVEGADKWRLLAGAEWVVLPSRSENFGMSVAEGLAAGTPALTTTTTPWEALARDDCGLQVAPTPAGIEAGMRAMLDRGHAERKHMGDRGRALIRRSYTWPAIAERMLAAYDDLAL